MNLDIINQIDYSLAKPLLFETGAVSLYDQLESKWNATCYAMIPARFRQSFVMPLLLRSACDIF